MCHLWGTQQWGHVIQYSGENVSDKTGILLTGAPHEKCEHYGALTFEAEKMNYS
jgi:hypothetical protein